MTSDRNFTIYLVGFLVVIAGLAYGAYLLGAPPVWIGIGVVVLLGIGILSAVKRTQGKAVPADSREDVIHREVH